MLVVVVFTLEEKVKVVLVRAGVVFTLGNNDVSADFRLVGSSQ